MKTKPEKKELRKLLTKYFREIDENPFLPERHSAWFNYSKIGLKTELLLMHIDAVNKLQEKK